MDPAEGDIVLLRGGDGRLVAARYGGAFTDDEASEASLFDLTGVYAVDPDGAELASVTNSSFDPDEGEPSGRHDWGALGLPDGPRTRVSPIHLHRAQDDVALALGSDGYRRYATDRRMSIGPGDFIEVAGRTGITISVDRRTRHLELRFDDGTTETVGFDDIEELEQRR